jgi:hypothetical protein
VFHVLIATAGAPEFLQIQVRLLRALCADSLQVVVVNDAKDFADHSNFGQADAAEQISAVCKQEGLIELRYPQHLHRKRLRPPRKSLPSQRTSESLQFGYDNILKSGATYVAVIDSDMFPFVPFSFAELLGQADMAGIPQERTNRFFPSVKVKYLWNGVLLLNVENMRAPSKLDFGCGYVNFTNTDTGGRIAHYLNEFPGTQVQPIPTLHSGHWHTIPDNVPPPLADFIRTDPMNNGSFFSELYGSCLFHFRGGGNWQAVHGGRSFADRYKLVLMALRRLAAESAEQRQGNP